MRLLKTLILALLMAFPWLAEAQIPAPQINLSGNIGAQGFPVLNNGTLIMALDANRTMTAQETSALYIKVTSSVSLTATRNLIAPAGRFPFTIENATTGGQSIQIIGTSGGGVTISNGSTLSVWNDGTNFVGIGSAGGGGAPSGPCGGALAGTFPNCTIAGLGSAGYVPLSDGSGNLVGSANLTGDNSGNMTAVGTIEATNGFTQTANSPGLNGSIYKNTGCTPDPTTGASGVFAEYGIAAGELATLQIEGMNECATGVDDYSAEALGIAALGVSATSGKPVDLYFITEFDAGRFIFKVRGETNARMIMNGGSINFPALFAFTGPGLLKLDPTTGNMDVATPGTDYLTPTGSGAGLTGITLANVAAGTAPTSSGTYAFGNNPISDTSSATLSPVGVATNSSNFNSPPINFLSSYWNGTSAAVDTWVVQTSLSSGTNPSSTLSLFSGSGTSGAKKVSVPNFMVTGQTGSTQCAQFDTNGNLTGTGSACGGGGGGSTFQVNGAGLTSSTTINYVSGTGNGGVVVTNPSAGNVNFDLSKPIAGAGSGFTTGPNSGVTAGDLALFTGTAGQITDGAIAGSSVVTLTGTQTLTNKTLTSPTLTTPALGTPASGVVTNLTGTGAFNTTGQSGTVNAIAGNVSFSTGLSATGAGTIASPYVVTATGGGSGTVTSIATTSPITGGTITATGTIACPTCGVTGSPLSQFAATTSSQLAGVISDESGSGALIFGTGPTISQPLIMGASGASTSCTNPIASFGIAGTAYGCFYRNSGNNTGHFAGENGLALWTFDNPLTVSGAITATHFIGSGLPTIAAGAGAGTSPTVALVTATDLSGYITVTTGTIPTASAAVATVTFAATYGAAPKCSVEPSNVAAQALVGVAQAQVLRANTTTALFVLTQGATPLVAATAYEWSYLCTQ